MDENTQRLVFICGVTLVGTVMILAVPMLYAAGHPFIAWGLVGVAVGGAIGATATGLIPRRRATEQEPPGHDRA